MAEPFHVRTGRVAGRLASLGPGQKKRAFLAELEAELAGAERISAIDPARVEEIAKSRGIDLDRDLPTPRRGLYRRFLEYCLTDHALSESETEDLGHLQRLLHLEAAAVGAIHDEVARTIYGQAMDEVLDDYQLDSEEEDFLQRLRASIGLSEQAARSIRTEGEQRARHRYISRAAVHGNAFVVARGTEIELEGRSRTGFQAAVEAAIDGAPETIGPIRSAEFKSLHVEIDEDGARTWHVKLTTWL